MPSRTHAILASRDDNGGRAGGKGWGGLRGVGDPAQRAAGAGPRWAASSIPLTPCAKNAQLNPPEHKITGQPLNSHIRFPSSLRLAGRSAAGRKSRRRRRRVQGARLLAQLCRCAAYAPSSTHDCTSCQAASRLPNPGAQGSCAQKGWFGRTNAMVLPPPPSSKKAVKRPSKEAQGPCTRYAIQKC